MDSHPLHTHRLYGNTVSTSVSVNMHEVLRHKRFQAGDKLAFGGGAAGFTMAAMLGTWVE